MPHYYPLLHNKHYAKWMGGGLYYYPADLNTARFFKRLAPFLLGQTILASWVMYCFEQRTVYTSQTKPEWSASFVSDLDFNPPLWRHEIPGSIPYVRIVKIEDTWERVQKRRGKHWSDDWKYTKPWQVDDGQWENRRPDHHSYMH